jgi:muramoyltetrapeptide carboxypeptidase
MFAPKISPGDEIRIIAPSTSMIILKEAQIELAVERLTKLGFRVTFGKNADAHDEFFSSSISERIQDLHEAFTDPNVKGIMTAIGGYNANQLLKYIDYGLIAANPKIFCGFSDITALQLAIYQKTGLVTYSGPHLSSFGVKHGYEYTLDSFLTAVTNDAPYEITPSPFWSDDAWYLEQDKRTFHEQSGYTILQEGEAEGRLIGGNLSTINLLQGTKFMPSLKDCILFIEDDEESHSRSFDRDLQSLLHLPDAGSIKALLIGRFQKNSNITEEALKKIIYGKEELRNIPIIANVNVGHVQPFTTIPIGSLAAVQAHKGKTDIFIEQKE